MCGEINHSQCNFNLYLQTYHHHQEITTQRTNYDSIKNIPYYKNLLMYDYLSKQ